MYGACTHQGRPALMHMTVSLSVIQHYIYFILSRPPLQALLLKLFIYLSAPCTPCRQHIVTARASSKDGVVAPAAAPTAGRSGGGRRRGPVVVTMAG